MSTQSLLFNALANFDRTARMLKGQVDPGILQKLRHPRERIELTLSPCLRDNKIHIFKAFIVRHSDAMGPAKGGIRISPTVTLDDITGLAMEMTWKCSLIGVPFGGGKSGIVADPASLDPIDKETIVRSFARNAQRHIGPQIYVPAPDMGTNEQDMGHIKDAIAYSAGRATTDGCHITGKPVILGGIPGRREATGRGVVICVNDALKRCQLVARRTRAIVQGFGNVGSVVLEALDELGICVVGISDAHSAIYNSAGLNVRGVFEHYRQNQMLAGAPGAEQVDGTAMLEAPCDVLIPAATANQITSENAARIQAKIIVEAANAPTTPQADEILHRRGIQVLPDILCNAGGVFVSYLEYTQETQQEQMSLAEVNTRLRDRMTERMADVWQKADELDIPLRQAAMLLAVARVCEAVIARGLLP